MLTFTGPVHNMVTPGNHITVLSYTGFAFPKPLYLDYLSQSKFSRPFYLPSFNHYNHYNQTSFNHYNQTSFNHYNQTSNDNETKESFVLLSIQIKFVLSFLIY